MMNKNSQTGRRVHVFMCQCVHSTFTTQEGTIHQSTSASRRHSKVGSSFKSLVGDLLCLTNVLKSRLG